MVRKSDYPVHLSAFGVGRVKAAALFDISVSLFDRLVHQGVFPQPRVLGGRLIWDIGELGEAWQLVPHRDDEALTAGNPWDD